MSRIGKEPIKIEDGVEVKVDGRNVTLSGNGNEVTISLPEVLSAEITDGFITVTRSNDEKQSKSLHGTFRAILANAVRELKKDMRKD
jgi:large subunit ribosomal protein L6